jgi:hypothetical protein
VAKQQVKVGGMVVAYRPAYFSFVKCVKTTLLLCQLEYWQYIKDGWFWKTHNELTQEIGLTRNELDRARGRLLELSLIPAWACEHFACFFRKKAIFERR